MKYLKKKLPKSRAGEILDELGGGPRGFSRSAKIKEVQTKPKKSLMKQKVKPKDTKVFDIIK
mgnify:FL=1